MQNHRYHKPSRWCNLSACEHRVYLLKLKPGTSRRALAALAKEWDSISKDWESAVLSSGKNFRYEFLDQKYAALHAQPEQLESAFSAFTLLSVAIAAMGRFSMSAYSISLRRKEISMFILANVIALPLGYLLLNCWLAIFAYRIAMHWWMFAVAGLAAVAIALLSISGQTIRAAIANPVDSLRDE